MEAPKIIYLFRNPIGVILDSWYLDSNAPFEKFEYVRKDAFIEKAEKFLKSYQRETPDKTGYISGVVDDKMIEDFKTYMKGE